MKRLSRMELRRRRNYREAAEWSGVASVNHDAAGLMAVIDKMPKRLRDEINERGLQQDIFDRLPLEWQARIAAAIPGNVVSDVDVRSIWDD